MARLTASSVIYRLHIRLNVNYRVTDREWQDYDVSLSLPIRGARLGISYTERLTGDARRLSGSLSIPLILRWATLGLGLFASGRGRGEADYGLSLRFSGGLGWDPHTRRLQTSREPLTRHGSFLGRLFLDFDGDGYQDEDEPPLSGIRFYKDERLMSPVSYEERVVHLPMLTPYTHHILMIDEVSLPDPFYFPKDPALSVMVRPGRTTTASIPILAAGGISGEVMLVEEDLPEQGAARILLLLLDEEKREVARTRTEFDGFFYIDRIPPGEYRLIPDKKQLLDLEIEAYPVYYDIVIPVSAEPIFIDDLNFRLTRLH